MSENLTVIYFVRFVFVSFNQLWEQICEEDLIPLISFLDSLEVSSNKLNKIKKIRINSPSIYNQLKLYYFGSLQ